jgi:hypothetical protein
MHGIWGLADMILESNLPNELLEMNLFYYNQPYGYSAR